MKFLPLISLLFPALVAAQEWGSPAPVVQPASSNNNAVAAAAASNSTSTGHLVTLGQGDAITFTPNTLTANAGDTITFVVATASEAAHGVVESTANAPCTQRQGGFDSGLVNPGGNFSIVVNSTSPIYLFCPQFNPFDHCTDGMVMIINPGSSSAINSYINAATAVASEAVATAPAPVGVDIVSTSVSVIPSSASSSSGASSSGGSSPSSSSPSPTTTSGALRNVAGISAALLTAGLAFSLA